jgi:hypothetical protein
MNNIVTVMCIPIEWIAAVLLFAPQMTWTSTWPLRCAQLLFVFVRNLNPFIFPLLLAAEKMDEQ